MEVGEMSKELIERLRGAWPSVPYKCRDDINAACDRIEELEYQIVESEYNNRGLVELYLEHRDQLAERDAQIALLREALEVFAKLHFEEAIAALAAIDDAKLLEGLVLCDAEPVGFLVEGKHGGKVIAHGLHHSLSTAKDMASEFAKHYPEIKTTPLYARRKE